MKVWYRCGECRERQLTTARERTRASGLRCAACGSRWMAPSQAGEKRLTEHDDLKRVTDAQQDAKRGVSNP